MGSYVWSYELMLQGGVFEILARNIIMYVSPPQWSTEEECHCVGSLFSCWYLWDTSLWSTGEYCKMASQKYKLLCKEEWLDVIFQRDNASAQIPKTTKKWLENKSITLML